MRKILYLLFITNFYLLPVHSGTSESNDPPGVDTVKVSCLYRQICVMDTLNPQKKTDDLMLLQIGNHVAKYFSYTNYLSDSVVIDVSKKAKTMGNINMGQELRDESRKLPRGSDASKWRIFKHYPKKEQLTFYQYFGLEGNMYEEAMPDFHWKLSTDTLTVCGYMCKKATTAFRGRNYEVWYTGEIPVGDGPWKFSGLPGLILKVTDDQGFFSFECTAIETPSVVKPIEFLSGKNARKLSRTEFNKAFQRFMDNPGAYITGSPLITDALPAHNYKKRPYNPIERTDE